MFGIQYYFILLTARFKRCYHFSQQLRHMVDFSAVVKHIDLWLLISALAPACCPAIMEDCSEESLVARRAVHHVLVVCAVIVRPWHRGIPSLPLDRV